jgi:CheY-like chemotaxis protein
MPDPLHILLVDDDLQVVKFLKKTLEAGGYAVTATTSGQEALTRLRQEPPDLLIHDLNMPEPDGFDLLKIARSEFPYLRVLAISGYLKGALLDAAKIVGATATLEKPLTAEKLLSKVREMLGR